MKAKLKDYIDIIFEDAPRTGRVAELKEEMLQNLYEKYDDLLAEGKSPAAAYNIAVAGVGDVSGLIADLQKGEAASQDFCSDETAHTLSDEDKKVVQSYRNRSAVLTSVAIALYILCIIPTILLGDSLGVICMFFMVAVATCLMVFNSMSKPDVLRGHMKKKRCDSDYEDGETPGGRNPVYKAISGALWCLTVIVYLGVSIWTGGWVYTWLIFLITTAIDNIIKACFDLRG